MVSLLPLADGDEIARFDQRLRAFTRQMGPLSLSKAVDDAAKPVIWYAVDCNDPIALELLLDQGVALSAFVANRAEPLLAVS